jgi:HEPN domain-containing protein
MKDETKIWLGYADENLESAIVLLDRSLFNACLQNVQQCVEKLLKALLVEFSDKVIKTHNIAKLRQISNEQGVTIDISEDECDLLDTIYLPSKYPISSVIPDYQPDAEICSQCIEIAERVEKSVKANLVKTDTE